MSKCSLGIFDTETEYAGKLGAYIMFREGEGFEPHVFTDEKRLMESLSSLDFALVPEHFTEAYDNPKLVRMVEKYDSLPGLQIEKYRRAPDIVSRMRELFGISAGKAADATSRIVCVVSPCRHELQMLFSLCLCKEWSINERVIYVNLQESSGFASLFDCGEGRNLEDLLAALDGPDVRIESYVRQVQGVSVLVPSQRPEALWEAGEDAIGDVMRLLETGGYDRIVVDMGASFPGSYGIYASAGTIITLCRETFLGEECHKEWCENLRRHLGGDILEREKRLFVTLVSTGIRESEFLLDELHRGNLGDFIRENITNCAE